MMHAPEFISGGSGKTFRFPNFRQNGQLFTFIVYLREGFRSCLLKTVSPVFFGKQLPLAAGNIAGCAPLMTSCRLG